MHQPNKLAHHPGLASIPVWGFKAGSGSIGFKASGVEVQSLGLRAFSFHSLGLQVLIPSSRGSASAMAWPFPGPCQGMGMEFVVKA